MAPSSVHPTRIVARASCVPLLGFLLACSDTGPPAPSEPGLDPNAPWYEETFQEFRTTNEMCAAVVYCYGQESLEEGALFDGTRGKFVRTEYSGENREEEAGVNLASPRAPQDRPREIWGEVYVRYDEDWHIATDDKTLFVLEDWRYAGGDAEVFRWGIFMRGHGDWYGGPYYRLEIFSFPAGVPDQDTEVWDGEWHRLRFHFKMASDASATDGAYEVWWDERLVESRIEIPTDTDPRAFFRVVALGRNADPIPGTGIRDWGRLRILVADPEW